MKPLNRPMFRMGGPIKEGIMDGIEEPRMGFQNGTPPGFFGLSFEKPILTGESFRNLFKTPAQVKQENLFKDVTPDSINIKDETKTEIVPNIFTPDYSMSDYGKVPKIVNQEDTLLASAAPDNIKVPGKKMEMVDPNIITTADITEQAGLEIPDRDRGKILTDPDKKPKDPKADSELLQKLGYDRAVKRGNYQLIEAIRRGLTEGGVQGALDAAFAAGAQDPYGEASKIRQAAALKEYERKTSLEDKKELIKYRAKFDKKKTQADSVRTKDYNFAINTLGMTKEEAIDYANKTSSVAENIFKVTSRSQGGFAAPNQLADAIRAAGEKVDAVFDVSDDATKDAYPAKDGQYVVFDQEVFIGYKDPNSDEVLLRRIR